MAFLIETYLKITTNSVIVCFSLQILSEFQGEGGVRRVETPHHPDYSFIASFILELKLNTTSFYSSFVFLNTTSAR